MAKKVLKLSFLDIIMGAEAETIKSAYEAKVRIDEQLAIREEAYRRIAEIEDKVEEIVGMQGQFVFPAPPLPVAGVSKPTDSTKTATRTSTKASSSSAKESSTKGTDKPEPPKAADQGSSGSSDSKVGETISTSSTKAATTQASDDSREQDSSTQK